MKKKREKKKRKKKEEILTCFSTSQKRKSPLPLQSLRRSVTEEQMNMRNSVNNEENFENICDPSIFPEESGVMPGKNVVSPVPTYQEMRGKGSPNRRSGTFSTIPVNLTFGEMNEDDTMSSGEMSPHMNSVDGFQTIFDSSDGLSSSEGMSSFERESRGLPNDVNRGRMMMRVIRPSVGSAPVSRGTSPPSSRGTSPRTSE